MFIIGSQKISELRSEALVPWSSVTICFRTALRPRISGLLSILKILMLKCKKPSGDHNSYTTSKNMI